MVFCRGCGHSIHISASVCPKCGAPQTVASANSDWGNSTAWIIAFAPLIGAFAEGFFYALFHRGGSFLFLITLGINIFLCSYDEKQLKATGIDTTNLGNVWLVPIYLFNRAKLLGEKPAYAIVWCVLFLAQIGGAL